MRNVTVVSFLILAAIPAANAQRSGGPDDWSSVDSALGRKGAANPGQVMKYSFPRGDLQVTVQGVQLKAALALGSWVAFKHIGGGHAMVMGDLVLAEDEVSPVMHALQAGGVQQTALHNHVLGESPRIMYMHVAAHGDALKIAETLHDAIGASRTPMAMPAAAPPAPVDLDTAAVARALGFAGKVNGGVYQVSIPRRETIREGSNVIPAAMGVATALNFQPTGNGKAAITGDFVMIAGEVNAVIRALHEQDIEVTALHSHMLGETPRLFFMHFWANGDAVKLAQGLRAALAKMAVKR